MVQLGALAEHAGGRSDSPEIKAALSRQGRYLGRLAEQAALGRREASAVAIRTRERYAAVQDLRQRGKRIKAIMRELGLAKETVRRFARAGSVEDLLATARDGRSSILDEFKPYLHHRFNLSRTNGSALFAEIQAQGYRGSLGTVLGYLRPFRALRTAPPAVPPPPTVRAVTGAILRHPDRRDADDQLIVKQVRARRARTWTPSLRRDETAVRNGLTLAHSSGAVEGAVNRVE